MNKIRRKFLAVLVAGISVCLAAGVLSNQIDADSVKAAALHAGASVGSTVSSIAEKPYTQDFIEGAQLRENGPEAVRYAASAIRDRKAGKLCGLFIRKAADAFGVGYHIDAIASIVRCHLSESGDTKNGQVTEDSSAACTQ